MFYVHSTSYRYRTMIDIFFIVKYVSCNFYIIERFNENLPFLSEMHHLPTTAKILFTARQILGGKGRETNKNSCPVIRFERGQQLNDENHDWKLEISNPPAHSPAAMQFPL